MMTETLERLISQVEKPSRYTGGEMNAVTKPFEEAEVTFAFCFPDTYEVAMSHLGMKILYGILNDLPYALCERVCMPWKDMRALLRQHSEPLFSLESKTALNKFDIIGFTLQYEMSYTNILDMLSMGFVTVKSAERREDEPIVVAGGPCAFNPEPLTPFIDAFMIGDGEEVIIELTNVIRDGRRSGVSREDILFALSQLRGVYVPRFYDAAYNADGTLASLAPNRTGVPQTVQKCMIKDMDKAYFPDKIPVPYTQIVFDRIMLEIMRGCTRGCRFCQAGMLYRPVRERSVETLMAQARALVDSTGYEEISLSSLSSGDYSCLKELSGRMMDELSEKRVSISLPSLRVDSDLKDALIDTQRVKKSGLTLAPEAGSQRLRDVINKGVTKDDLLKTLSVAFENGWNTVKLYFMMGLPTETKEDLEGIALLAREAASRYYAVPKGQRAKGLKITCSASVFVPKPFTPFQWCAQDKMEAVREKQQYVRSLFTARNVVFHYHDSLTSQLEACFAVGDRRLGEVLYRAWELGCVLDGWSECFRYDLWMKAFADCGLDPAFYCNRVRGLDEVLPWDHIDAGVSKAYLKKEYERALQAQTTRDCREGCNGCGLQAWGACRICE